MITTSASSSDSLPGTISALRRPRASGSPSRVSATRNGGHGIIAEQGQRLAVEQELTPPRAHWRLRARSRACWPRRGDTRIARWPRPGGSRCARSPCRYRRHRAPPRACRAGRATRFDPPNRRWVSVRIVADHDAAVLHQERQRRQHVACGSCPGSFAVGVAIAADAEEHRVEIVEQVTHRHVTADLHAQLELHAHASQISWRWSSTVFSSLKVGMPNCSRPPIFS